MTLRNRIKGMVAVLTAVVGTLGTIIGIVTFATGEESLPDIINGEETAEQVEVVAPPANSVFLGEVICGEGGMPIRLQQGAQGEVIASGVNLKSEPDARRNRSNIAELAQYTQFRVVGSPRCIGDVSWWNVETVDGQRGWLPENEGNTYLLNAR